MEATLYGDIDHAGYHRRLAEAVMRAEEDFAAEGRTPHLTTSRPRGSLERRDGLLVSACSGGLS